MVTCSPRSGEVPIGRQPGAAAVFALGLAGIYAWGVLLALLGDPIYGENDDWALAGSLSGAIGGTPEVAVPFIRPMLAWILAHAYTVFPSVGWFGLFCASVGLTSLGVLLSVGCLGLVARGWRVGQAFLLMAALAAPAAAWVALRPTFTASAMLAGGASVALFAFAARRGGRWGIPLVGALLMFALGFALRDSAALLGGVPVVPWAIVTSTPPARRLLWGGLAVISMGVALVGADALAARVQDANPAWRAYQTWNDPRGALHGTPAIPALASGLPRAGWNRAEYDQFAAMATLDRSAPSGTQLRRALEETSDLRGVRSLIHGQRLAALETLGRSTLEVGWLLIVGCIVIAVIALVGPRPPPRAIVGAGLTVGLTAGLGWYLSLSVRLPERGWFPLVAISVFAVSYCVGGVGLACRQPGQSPNVRPWLSAVLTLAVASILLSPQGPVRLNAVAANDGRWRMAIQAHLSTVPPALPLVVVGDTTLAAAESPYVAGSRPRRDTISLGWLAFSPAWTASVRRAGVRAEGVAEALGSGRLGLVATAEAAASTERYLRSLGAMPRGFRLCGRGAYWAVCRRD
jgi:hypothetical protein